MRRPQPREDMDVVGHATNGVCDAFQISDCPADIFVDPVARCGGHPHFTALGTENEMEVERKRRRWHEQYFSRSCRSAIRQGDVDPVVTLVPRFTTG